MNKPYRKWLIGAISLTLGVVSAVCASEKGVNEGSIRWRIGLEDAKKEAQESGKPIFFFFHHPMCGGCKKTINETFPEAEVKTTLDGEFVPLTYLVTEEEELVQQYNVNWTPTFIIADANGKEQDRWIGFLPPKDFLAQISLSQGHVAFKKGDFVLSQRHFERVLKGFPKSACAPEARYLLGVSLYKASKDPSHLKKTWEEMKVQYPGNEWTKRASPWGE